MELLICSLNQTQVNHNTVLFRFALPSEKHCLGLPVGKHMSLRCNNAEGKLHIRQYTPVSSDRQLGHFDLLIKLYPNGVMSQHLANMKIGETIEARGPQGHLEYLGAGRFSLRDEVRVVKRVNMIAGGSGITPMLQLLRAADDEANKTGGKVQFSLIFANVTEADILCRDELERIASARRNVKVFFTLDKVCVLETFLPFIS